MINIKKIRIKTWLHSRKLHEKLGVNRLMRLPCLANIKSKIAKNHFFISRKGVGGMCVLFIDESDFVTHTMQLQFLNCFINYLQFQYAMKMSKSFESIKVQ